MEWVITLFLLNSLYLLWTPFVNNSNFLYLQKYQWTLPPTSHSTQEIVLYRSTSGASLVRDRSRAFATSLPYTSKQPLLQIAHPVSMTDCGVLLPL